ncbi:deoxyribonuclease-1-like 1 isoform X1 [Hippocampus zosterae]|uniref:deoxyribonuclease-1-like 1 isoform X1 n=1 Tax=Hippocampus zosterae TaxID=109293 RepID=UPI00223CE491|nr:deoxyribonuclease-1-like 1 isoform X1 [Hippocampus zosterae]
MFHKEGSSQKNTTEPVVTMRHIFLLLLPCLDVCSIQAAANLRVCAFNLQHFGESKAKKQDVMQTYAKIITRCDVCLLQEVRDNRQKALPQLLEHLNKYDLQHEYKAVASERLGRSEAYQEQYVFVYRANKVTVTGQYQYPDDKPGDVDAFSREPFVVRFKAPKTAIKEFVLIPQHTSPANVSKELDALYDVLQHVRRMWKTENIILLGDFNADCAYLSKRSRGKLRLFRDSNLFWLMPEKTDTTVRDSTSCAYDRIVVHGDTLANAVVPFSAKPFNFQMEYRLSEEEALKVSDHYPIEVLLKNNASKVSFSLFLVSLLIFSADESLVHVVRWQSH